MYKFIKRLTPLHRQDAVLGRHWVWESLKSKMKKIAAVMVMSGHCLPVERLKYTGEDECILSEVTCFKKLTDDENLNDYQGCYLISDEARGTLIKSELLIE